MRSRRKSTLETVQERVESILSEEEYARNNDFYLIILDLKRYHYVKCYGHGDDKGHELWIRPKDLENVKSVETIRRCRQKIQNKYHKFMPTDPQIRKRRRIAESVYRKYAVDED